MILRSACPGTPWTDTGSTRSQTWSGTGAAASPAARWGRYYLVPRLVTAVPAVRGRAALLRSAWYTGPSSLPGCAEYTEPTPMLQVSRYLQYIYFKMNINQTWMRCLTMSGMLRSRDILRANHSLTSAWHLPNQSIWKWKNIFRKSGRAIAFNPSCESIVFMGRMGQSEDGIKCCSCCGSLAVC